MWNLVYVRQSIHEASDTKQASWRNGERRPAAGASALGADDVVAGNLVLVALAAVGAYLFYFDGGVTQAALASQAVQEVASGEGELVAQAPREEAESRGGDLGGRHGLTRSISQGPVFT